MQFPALLISDLHLVDKPDAAYRWTLFEWLHQTIKEEKVKFLYVLGDLTDAKDNHSAELVNRVVNEIDRLTKAFPNLQIVILAGNHDWLKAGHEFFKFLNVIKNVVYINKPTEDPDVHGPLTYYLPYSKNPAKDWEGLDFSHYEFLFMHQTIKGAVSSNGQEMEGENLPKLDAGKVYSGDIHVPQVIGGVEYVGSPYHVHFGDNFKPRCVLLESKRRAVDLHFETISRVTVKVGSLDELYNRRDEFKAGDQVKLRIELSEADKHGWSKTKRQAANWLLEQGCLVHGVELIVVKSTRRRVDGLSGHQPCYSPSEAITRFVEAEALGGDALEIAMEVIEP